MEAADTTCDSCGETAQRELHTNGLCGPCEQSEYDALQEDAADMAREIDREERGY